MGLIDSIGDMNKLGLQVHPSNVHDEGLIKILDDSSTQ